jgi:hypothetical protein
VPEEIQAVGLNGLISPDKRKEKTIPPDSSLKNKLF